MVDTTGLSRTNFMSAQSPKKQIAPQNSSLAHGEDRVRRRLFDDRFGRQQQGGQHHVGLLEIRGRTNGRSPGHGPAPPAAGAGRTGDRSDELEEDEDDEADEGEGLGEGDAEEHGGADHAGGLGLAGHGLDRLADEVADADARADGGEAVGETGTGGAGVGLGSSGVESAAASWARVTAVASVLIVVRFSCCSCCTAGGTGGDSWCGAGLGG